MSSLKEHVEDMAVEDMAVEDMAVEDMAVHSPSLAGTWRLLKHHGSFFWVFIHPPALGLEVM